MHRFKQFSLFAITAFGFGLFNSIDCHPSKEAERCLILTILDISNTSLTNCRSTYQRIKALEDEMELCFVLGGHNDRTDRSALYRAILSDQIMISKTYNLVSLIQKIGGTRWQRNYRSVIEKCFDDAFDLVTNQAFFQAQPNSESVPFNLNLISEIIGQMTQSLEAAIDNFGVFIDDQNQIQPIIKFLEERRESIVANSSHLLELGFVRELPKAFKPEDRKRYQTFRITRRGGIKQRNKTPKQFLQGINFSNHIKSENLKKIKNFQVAIHGKGRTFSS